MVYEDTHERIRGDIVLSQSKLAAINRDCRRNSWLPGEDQLSTSRRKRTRKALKITQCG